MAPTHCDIPHTAPRRGNAALMLAVALVAIWFASALAQSPLPSASSDLDGNPPAMAADAQPVQLQREGSYLTDQPGHFRLAGNRVSFVSIDGKAELIGLENLNLQRVARIMTANSGGSEWIVSGLVTEYQGANYLLVTRAIRKHAARSRRDGY